MINEQLLQQLLLIEGTAGDEQRVAAFLERYLAEHHPHVTLHRIGNSLIAVKGTPRVAVFAHTDSVGFLLAHRKRVLALGGPMVEEPVRIRSTQGDTVFRAVIGPSPEDHREFQLLEGEGPLGSAWVYDTTPVFHPDRFEGAYLDNRFGVYTGLHLLDRVDDVLIAFTAVEEATGRGAIDCARWIYENTAIRQSLICDITFATDDVTPGKGPVVSLRDAFIPRRVYFERCRAIAEAAGIPHQLEIETVGGSDGAMIERSGFGMDWCFVGAPEDGYHSAHEILLREDAENMLRLYEALVVGLSRG